MDAKEQKNPQMEKVKEMIEDIRIGMLTTIDEDGSLVSRPMACMQIDENGSLWFFTKKDSPKTDQIEHHEHKVNVSFTDVGDADFVSISGTATEIYDRAKINDLWSPAAKPWFPDGKDDQSLILLRVDTKMAEYWDSTASRMVRLMEMARAAVTGDTYKEGENKKVYN
ncbi:pyridoxamine 5'-phosphate oxidase family protein [Nibrella viscosa]|uniref:Pyridoxamine 5'-phosphate oxidase family protein n=1 Tax=Nibrella viscosa TaxID=1084524 RepID=A0ABP8KEH5_9BACT